MHYDPQTDKQPQALELLQRCTGPRPLAWLSSANADGKVDLRVFNHWQWLSPQSPTLMFSAEQSDNGERSPTVENAEQTGWFVWNMATSALKDSVQRSTTPATTSTDAFQQAGVAKAPSIMAPCPRVAQSPLQLECRYISTQRIPACEQGRFIDIVLAEVARIHIKDELFADLTAEQQAELQPLLHLAGNEYVSAAQHRAHSRRAQTEQSS